LKIAAIVVGASTGTGAALRTLAHNVGFDPVLRYETLARAEAQLSETPLLFFLCAGVDDVRTLKPMAEAIRFSPARKLRFSPMIYFAHNPSHDTIKTCINMGFDDVIALPFAGERLEARINRQIGSPQIYYETSTYFGPDRRGRIEHDHGDPRRGSGGQFRRIEILRTAETGIDVLKDDMQVEL
jgi:hypothetical protein